VLSVRTFTRSQKRYILFVISFEPIAIEKSDRCQNVLLSGSHTWHGLVFDLGLMLEVETFSVDVICSIIGIVVRLGVKLTLRISSDVNS
jgi:hypothetical protein